MTYTVTQGEYLDAVRDEAGTPICFAVDKEQADKIAAALNTPPTLPISERKDKYAKSKGYDSWAFMISAWEGVREWKHQDWMLATLEKAYTEMLSK